jgi:2-methylcitrate dehydratase PrpD
LTIKKYPMCFATHRVIDAILDLASANDLKADAVQAVHATVGATQASMLRNHRPQSALEAKFSLEFAVAAALIAHKVGLSEVGDDFVRRPDVQALFDRVHVLTVDTVCPSEPTLALSDRVRIELADGTLLDSGEVREARGSLSSPLTIEELGAKFRDCTARVQDLETAALFERMCHLDEEDDVSRLP